MDKVLLEQPYYFHMSKISSRLRIKNKGKQNYVI